MHHLLLNIMYSGHVYPKTSFKWRWMVMEVKGSCLKSLAISCLD
jgi:hypothetical protein